MKLTGYMQGHHSNDMFHPLVRWTLTEVTDLGEVVSQVRQLGGQLADAHPLITLDDAVQARYTSMHAGEDDLLYVGEDEVDPDASEEEWDTPEFEFRMAVAQARHIAQVLADPSRQQSIESLEGTRPSEPAFVEALVRVNSDPMTVIDSEIHVLSVPVENPLDIIAGFPNGYFEDDWDVLSNHALTRHLSENYGYRPLGIGASWIGFERDSGLGVHDAQALTEQLKRIYGEPDAAEWTVLGDLLTKRDVLLLGYSENFADM